MKDGIAKIPREWFRVNEWILFAQGLGDLAVLALGAWACIAFPTLWVRVPVWILMAGRMHALGILMHDLVHVAALKRSVAKKLLFDAVICWPILFNMDYYGLAHHIHHAESNLPGRDPYFVFLYKQNPFFYPVYVTVGSALLVLVLVLRVALWPLTLVWPALYRWHVKVFSQLGASPDLENAERTEQGKGIWIWALGPLACWTVIFGLVHVNGLWAAFGLAYGIPMLLSSILGQVRLACDHIYTEALGNSMVEQVAGATNVVAPWWQQIVMGAHGTSYHALHHLVPTLPNYHFKAAHEIMMQSGSQVYARTVYPGYGAVFGQLLRAQWAWTRTGAPRTAA